ncbi:hypothetical protein HU200_019665 [Digitaria exilis]|uniref:Uncharacterized protein n=1 Tax=Digitaria exilis TaxID=1010633 RepID=A0A835KCF4_9POAL|nr:hypothetical protein HU200_019665 [Digitaria exilis]
MIERTDEQPKFCVGCVIHKSETDTYILTQSKFITRNCRLIIHFSVGEKLDAQWLTGREGDQSAVLHLGVQHHASTPIQFYNGSIGYSEALCIVPKEPSSFQRFWGRITKPSCASARDDGTVVPNMHFIYNCHHEGTALMTPAPVFHQDGGVSGFVVTDAGKADIHSKLCLKAMAVEMKLQTLLDSDNWRVNFRFLLILFWKKGMKLTA